MVAGGGLGCPTRSPGEATAGAQTDVLMGHTRISDYNQIMKTELDRIRSFNRTVTQRIGVLNERYLGRDRPLVESRLLFEIGTRGASVREMRARLGLDSGFVSRLLRSLERKGLATTARRAAQDGRMRFASLTKSGLVELRRINALSDELAKSMLHALTSKQSQRLVEAMSEVERLLRASGVEVVRANPASLEARICFEQYFGELSRRFRTGFDPSMAGGSGDFVPPKGCLLVASLLGEPVGCGALRTLAPGVGEIKRMWVAPSARGLGIARKLLYNLEQIALRRNLRMVRLDTNASLTEAQQLYRSSGYHEIERFNENPYADHWFEKRLA
jgi:DNA-binding MarR family transcriptional regulator